MIELIRKRLASYNVRNALEEEQATKEILQEVTLYLLWRANFFEAAAFQGGTSLRILHQLPRFSEDLEFILLRPDASFDWAHYLTQAIALRWSAAHDPLELSLGEGAVGKSFLDKPFGKGLHGEIIPNTSEFRKFLELLNGSHGLTLA